MLQFGISKTKMLIAMGEIRSVKVGASRRILAEWIDEYVAAVIARNASCRADGVEGRGRFTPYRGHFAAHVWVTTRPWSVDEARQFLVNARACGNPLYPACVLMLVPGLRPAWFLAAG